MKTEKRLIYKDDVIKMAWLDNECEVVTLSDIENMEPVNAVEVVRCKDCKHYKPQKKSVHWNNSTPYCCRCTVVKVNPNDFCSYGERKADG